MISTISPEECTPIKDLDMALGELHTVQLCVEADEFQFRAVVKKNPLTRRGVLSMVASVYDPLGFVALYVLVCKLILQELCRDKSKLGQRSP